MAPPSIWSWIQVQDLSSRMVGCSAKCPVSSDGEPLPDVSAGVRPMGTLAHESFAAQVLLREGQGSYLGCRTVLWQWRGAGPGRFPARSARRRRTCRVASTGTSGRCPGVRPGPTCRDGALTMPAWIPQRLGPEVPLSKLLPPWPWQQALPSPSMAPALPCIGTMHSLSAVWRLPLLSAVPGTQPFGHSSQPL